MPRAEPGTPKWLANKMKAKGLQKLKWYCQMCEKQCRDENGFKCHRLSETHQRQMQIFCQNANKFMDEYSQMFEKEFMRLMKTRFCRTRILANTVYTNLISDKSHIHMNSTVWVTLTDFVLYLGKTGKCKIEHTERGWYLEYIDREKIEREKAFNEKKKIEYSYEQLKEKKINDAIEEAKRQGKYIESEYTGIEKKTDEKIVISSIKKNTCINETSKPNVNVFLTKALINNNEKKKKLDKSLDHKELSKKRPLSSLELLILENEEKKKKKNNSLNIYDKKEKISENKNKPNEINSYVNLNKKISVFNTDLWICKNIVVKVIDKNHKYYKKKGIIVSISSNNKEKCEIELDNKETFFAYQKQLQTVIPQIGKKILVVQGKYKGLIGKIKEILIDDEIAVVELNYNNLDKTTIEKFSYNDICKLR